MSENLKNGLFRGKIFFSRKKNHTSEGQFFKNDKMCNSYESRSVSARAESYKKVRKQIYKKIFYLPMLFGIRDGKKSGSGIRDKHSGSATLPIQQLYFEPASNWCENSFKAHNFLWIWAPFIRDTLFQLTSRADLTRQNNRDNLLSILVYYFTPNQKRISPPN